MRRGVATLQVLLEYRVDIILWGKLRTTAAWGSIKPEMVNARSSGRRGVATFQVLLEHRVDVILLGKLRTTAV